MPTVLREGKFRFFFFSNEGAEPRHVHVESGDKYAKFWLESASLAKSAGFSDVELRKIRELVIKNAELLKEKWDAYFNF